MSFNLLEGFLPFSSTEESYYKQCQYWSDFPLWQLIYDRAKENHSAISVQDDQHVFTYDELITQADCCAAYLQHQGFKVGECVLFQAANNVFFTVYLLAILRAGLVPVMALPGHRERELSHLASLSGAVAFLTSDRAEQEALFSALTPDDNQIRQIISIPNSLAEQPYITRRAADYQSVTVDPSWPALFLVSGGTTGLPKLIPRSHQDYGYNIRCSLAACQISQADRYLVVLPAAHNFPLACPGLLSTLAAGGQVYFASIAAPDYCFNLIQQQGITMTSLVPALAQLWGEATAWESADLSSLRLLQVGGAKLPESEARKLMLAFPGALQQVFGMAEGLICYTHQSDGEELIVSSQGRPMSRLDKIRIVDEWDRDVADGEEGELLVKGPYTLRGYYRAEQYNCHAFTPDGYYRSGDKVRKTDNGNLVVTGRLKDIIIRNGENIAADEIEGHLLAHPAVRQVAVIALPDRDTGERVAAAIVPHAIATPPTLSELREYLRQQGLAEFKLPERMNLLGRLPVTAVGKIDKKAILGLAGVVWH